MQLLHGSYKLADHYYTKDNKGTKSWKTCKKKGKETPGYIVFPSPTSCIRSSCCLGLAATWAVGVIGPTAWAWA